MGRLRSTILEQSVSFEADGEGMDGPLLDGIHLVAVDLELVVDDIEGERKADPLLGDITAL